MKSLLKYLFIIVLSSGLTVMALNQFAPIVITIPKKDKQEIKIDGDNLNQINSENQDNTDIFIIIKMSKVKKQFTANTKAPIVINPNVLKGCQVILENPNLQIEHPLDLA